MSTESRQVDLIWDAEDEEPPGLKLPEFLDNLLDQLQLDAVELSVLMTGDEAVKELNDRFREKKKTTDVLSFPAFNSQAAEASSTGRRHLGDIAISVDRAKVQASEIGQSLDVELRFLCLHGVLHLLGYDHETDNGEMLALQNQLKNNLAVYF